MAKIKNQKTIRIYDHYQDKIIEVPEKIAEHRLRWYHVNKGGTICREDEIAKYFETNPQYNQEAPPAAVVQTPSQVEETVKFETGESLSLEDMTDESLRELAQEKGIKLGRTKKRDKIIEKILKAEQK